MSAQSGHDVSAASDDDVQIAREDRKVHRTPLPKMQLFLVVLVMFAEPVSSTVIYPFVNAFVRETGITEDDEKKTGYYAGIIVSHTF